MPAPSSRKKKKYERIPALLRSAFFSTALAITPAAAEEPEKISSMDFFMASGDYTRCVGEAFKKGEAALRETETFKMVAFKPGAQEGGKRYDINGDGDVKAGLHVKSGPTTLTFQMEGNVHDEKIAADASITLDWDRSSVLGTPPKTETPMMVSAAFDGAAGGDFAAFLANPAIRETWELDTKFGPDFDASRNALVTMTADVVRCAGHYPGFK